MTPVRAERRLAVGSATHRAFIASVAALRQHRPAARSADAQQHRAVVSHCNSGNSVKPMRWKLRSHERADIRTAEATANVTGAATAWATVAHNDTREVTIVDALRSSNESATPPRWHLEALLRRNGLCLRHCTASLTTAGVVVRQTLRAGATVAVKLCQYMELCTLQ